MAILVAQTAVALPVPLPAADDHPNAAPYAASASGSAFEAARVQPAHTHSHGPLAASGIDPAGLLPSLPWAETVNQVNVISGQQWRTLRKGGDDAPIQGTIQFKCPDASEVPALENGYNTMTFRATCPFRIVDDADLLGSPQIAVHPNDPNSMAIFSLHGAGTDEGPTPRSRDPSPEGVSVTGLSHSTFTSVEEGMSWYDNPWGTDGFGEHASGVMDRDGNIYIAALWSKRLGDGNFDYVTKLYKESEGRYQISTYQPSKTIANRAEGNPIEESNLVYIKAATKFPPGNITENSTSNLTGPADPSQVGNSTRGDDVGGNHPDDRVMVVWHERALDWRNSTTGKSSWIDAAWTDTTDKDNWTRLADTELIGPCMAASNPVAYNGQMYVACVADAGYNGRSRARIGDIDIWRVNPLTGESEIVDFTRLVGGRPRLAAREDGYMAVASVDLESEHNVDAQVAFGWYGRNWDHKQNTGSDLHRLIGMTGTTEQTGGVETGDPIPAREARITAMALTDEHNTLFLAYMERSNTTIPPPDANPNPNPTRFIEYRKIVTTFDQCGAGPVDAYDLQTGVARHPFQNEADITGEEVGNATGVFDDLQDGMQYYVDDDGVEYVYFVYGDHGVLQYGALIAGDSGQPCSVFAPTEFFPPPPIPAALSATSPATTVVGSAVGATALAMVTYLLAAKRKTLNVLAAKDKRK